MFDVITWSEDFDPVSSAPCVVAGMPNEVYHNCPGISKSGLDRINKTPAHYKYGEFEPSKPMEIGTALHAALLEPAVFETQFTMLPDVKDRRASEYKKAVIAYGKGNVLVGKECAQVDGMIDAVNSNFRASRLMDDCQWREVSVFAYDPVTNELCKCRFDALGKDRITNKLFGADLKTTADAGDSGYLAFQNTIANRRYHVQDAFYGDVFGWATGIEISRFWFIAVESKRPHGVVCRYLDEESVNAGRDEYRENLDTYAQCAANDYWPCYEQPENDEDAVISLPDWKWRQIEDDVVEGVY